MIIKRDEYLSKLISMKHNGMIKIVTGLRRSGKSYLLNELFRSHLIKEGVLNENIIHISFDNFSNNKMSDKELHNLLMSQIINDKMHYFILDEVQLIKGFEFVLMSLMKIKNVDIYITGSNSKFLSSNVITEFRGRGFPIHVWPLTYKEIHNFYKENYEEYKELLNNEKKYTDFENKVYELYSQYGGLPQVVIEKDVNIKKFIIKHIFENVYYNDILDKLKIKDKSIYSSILEILATNIGNITNPNKLHNTIKSKGIKISYDSIEKYINLLESSFIIHKVKRLDYKRSTIIDGSYKIYFCDLGIRNHLLSFLNESYGFVLENIIANELSANGIDLRVGQINTNIMENKIMKRESLEIDFIFNSSKTKYYLQSCYLMDNKETYEKETRSLRKINDSFKKYIINRFTLFGGNDKYGIENIEAIDLFLDINEFIKR